MEQVLSESNLVISIDAMGGDNSPKVVIEGLALAHKRNPDIRFLVYGDEPKVTAEIAKFPALKEVCQIFIQKNLFITKISRHTLSATAKPVCTKLSKP